MEPACADETDVVVGMGEVITCANECGRGEMSLRGIGSRVIVTMSCVKIGADYRDTIAWGGMAWADAIDEIAVSIGLVISAVDAMPTRLTEVSKI